MRLPIRTLLAQNYDSLTESKKCLCLRAIPSSDHRGTTLNFLPEFR